MKAVFFDGTLFLIIGLCILGVVYLLYLLIIGEKKKPTVGDVGDLEKVVDEAVDIKHYAEEKASEAKEKTRAFREKLDEVDKKL